MTNNQINTCFITDDNYIMPTYISILSAKLHKNPNTQYSVFIIGYKLSDKNIDKFKELETNNFKIFIINKNELDIKDLSNEYIKLYSPAIFLKLELEKILSNCSKVLFLDSDIIITKDLSEVFNVDLNNYYIGASRDILPLLRINYIPEAFANRYFNVGVMLLNLDLIRKNDFFEKVKKHYIEKGSAYIYPEQDALNYMIQDKVKIISPKYNWTVGNYRYKLNFLANFFKLEQNEIKEENIVIFHYAGLKPWKDFETPYKKYWLKVYEQSCYKQIKLYIRKKYNLFSRIFIKLRILYRFIKYNKYYKGLLNG